VFGFVRFRGAGGGGVDVGLPRAEACRAGTPDCLPRLTMIDTAGAALTPEALAGKVVVVNVWATWCPPCRAEIPDLAAVHARYHDRGLVLIGLLTDDPPDAALAAFAADHGLTYPIVRADDELRAAFGDPAELPTTFVYDRSGRARYARPGAVTSRSLGRLVERLLAEPGGAAAGSADTRPSGT
jgi:thiol-disulfide isomerase/thioredoxin